MGQITVNNDVDGNYWKQLLTYLTGVPPTVEAVRDYRITLTTEAVDQNILDVLVSIRKRGYGRAQPVEVALPSLAEREDTAKLSLHQRIKE